MTIGLIYNIRWLFCCKGLSWSCGNTSVFSVYEHVDTHAHVSCVLPPLGWPSMCSVYAWVCVCSRLFCDFFIHLQSAVKWWVFLCLPQSTPLPFLSLLHMFVHASLGSTWQHSPALRSAHLSVPSLLSDYYLTLTHSFSQSQNPIFSDPPVTQGGTPRAAQTHLNRASTCVRERARMYQWESVSRCPLSILCVWWNCEITDKCTRDFHLVI